VTASGVSPEQARAIFARRVAAWLAADIDAYLACWTEDMEIVLPGRAQPVRGRDRYRALVEQSFAWAEPLAFDIHHLGIDPRSGAVLTDWTIRARRRDDGVVVEWRGLSSCGLRHDRIAWWKEYHHMPPAPLS
jgi:ketosteroid isomerase-like protein